MVSKIRGRKSQVILTPVGICARRRALDWRTMRVEGEEKSSFIGMWLRIDMPKRVLVDIDGDLNPAVMPPETDAPMRGIIKATHIGKGQCYARHGDTPGLAVCDRASQKLLCLLQERHQAALDKILSRTRLEMRRRRALVDPRKRVNGSGVDSLEPCSITKTSLVLLDWRERCQRTTSQHAGRRLGRGLLDRLGLLDFAISTLLFFGHAGSLVQDVSVGASDWNAFAIHARPERQPL